MYGKKTLDLEDVKQMLQNNELMKKIDSIEEASGLFIKGQRGRSKSRGLKRNPETSSTFSCHLYKKPGHIKKNYMKYKEMLKRKGGKILMKLVPVKSQIKPGLSKNRRGFM